MIEDKYLHIDNEFAGFICRLAKENSTETLKNYARELSFSIRSGWTYITVPQESEQQELLKAYPAVGKYPEDGLRSPMLLEGDKLFFQRYLKYEVLLAENLRRIAKLAMPELPPDHLDEVFAGLPPSQALEDQKNAVRNALRHPLAVISGGPGTGKTTVASVLLYHEMMRLNPEKIVILAPTGKAHMRLKESLIRDSQKFNIPEEYRDKFAGLPGGTIHRILKAGSNGFGFNETRKLPYDLILLDESSMVSLEIMVKLTAAMKDSARLIMLGDMAQLASVSTGQVFASLCQAVDKADDNSVFKGIKSELHSNFRAKDAPEVIELADALRSGKLPENTVIKDLPSAGKMPQLLRQELERFKDLSKLCSSGKMESFAEAFSKLDTFKVICAVNSANHYGTSGINRTALSILKLTETSPGVPIMIRRNDYGLKLFNGDMGLITSGKLVYFPDRQELLPLNMLPEYETAYAITAHKSQGSGYDRVLLLLPPEESPLLSTSLIYTAVTRARKSVVIRGNQQEIEKVLAKPVEWQTDLTARLLKNQSSNSQVER